MYDVDEKDLLVTILTSCWTFWCFTWLETLTIVTLVIYCTILIWSTFGEANLMINMAILWWLTVLVHFTRCNTNVFVTFCASYAMIVISTAFLAFIMETNFLISTLVIIFTLFLTERSWPVEFQKKTLAFAKKKSWLLSADKILTELLNSI